MWRVVAQRYSKLVSVPARHRQLAAWPALAWFAVRHGMGSNIGYLSRSDPARRVAGGRAHLHALTTGAYEPSTAYLVDSELLWPIAVAAMRAGDVAVEADGLRLILPGARSSWPASLPVPKASVPERISFGAEGNGAGLLIDGWWWSEWWGTWSADENALIALPVPANERVRVTLRWQSIVRRDRPQRLRVRMGDATFHVEFPATRDVVEHSFNVRTASPLLEVELDIAERLRDPSQPHLGVALIEAIVSPVR